MREVTLTYRLTPCPRPRHSKWGTYMPTKYMQAKKQLAQMFKDLEWPTLDGAVSVYVVCKHAIPTSWSKKQREAVLLGGEYALPVGDVDNLFKHVGDALTDAGVWGDDKQIAHLSFTKQYGLVDELYVRISAWHP